MRHYVRSAFLARRSARRFLKHMERYHYPDPSASAREFVDLVLRRAKTLPYDVQRIVLDEFDPPFADAEPGDPEASASSVE